jgi:osmotically-inducible protein OsmY
MEKEKLSGENQNTEDIRLQKDILALLQEDPKTDASKMLVEVNNGEVLLKGRADTEEEKNHAAIIAASVAGVKQVENHLHVEIGIAHALSSFAAKIASGDNDNKNADKDKEQKS